MRVPSDPVLVVVLGRRDGDVEVVESTGFEMVDWSVATRERERGERGQFREEVEGKREERNVDSPSP